MSEVLPTEVLRAIEANDLPDVATLLPELADFNVPSARNPDDLWMGDLKLAEQVARGAAPDAFCDVLYEGETLLGLILVSMRPEPLSGTPSAHLEGIAVSPNARGKGVGRRLLAHAEAAAQARGAGSLTLHVFGNNTRARGLYASSGYDEEIIRCIKWL